MSKCPFWGVCTEKTDKCPDCLHAERRSYFIPTEDYKIEDDESTDTTTMGEWAK